MTPPVANDPRLRVPATDILVVAGVALLATVGAGAATSVLLDSDADFVYSPTAMLLVIATYACMGGAALWAARRTGDARRAFGLVAPPSWPRALGLALLTVLGALIASGLLEHVFHGAEAQDIVPDAGRPPGAAAIAGIVLAYVAVALIGPLAEELLFRGLLTAAFRQRFGAKRTMLITAALFAVAHFIPRVMPAVFLLGLALAFVYERVGSTVPGILIHCLYNGIALTAAVTKH